MTNSGETGELWMWVVLTLAMVASFTVGAPFWVRGILFWSWLGLTILWSAYVLIVATVK